LQALQSNPKEAMEKFKDHKDVTDFLHEFCSLLGDHFTQLGDEEQVSSSSNSKSQTQIPSEEDVGPIAFRALQKEKERRDKGEPSLSHKGMTKQEQEQHDAIMKNEELTKILMDVDMQRVIHECSTIPGKMQVFMRHDVYGVKLRKLIHAGLLKVA